MTFEKLYLSLLTLAPLIQAFTPISYVTLKSQQNLTGVVTPLRVSSNDELSKAPTLNGKLLFSSDSLMKGLSNHKVAAVYAVQSIKSKPDEWRDVIHVAITKDLYVEIESLRERFGSQVTYVRALSFAYPQKAAMMETANRWANNVDVSGGVLGGLKEIPQDERDELVKLMVETAYDDDDDDDEFEFYDNDYNVQQLFIEKTARSNLDKPISKDGGDDNMVSPFSDSRRGGEKFMIDNWLDFNLDAVDKVLDEIRPYLISDGGNVSIHCVDVETRSVYLVLEGACGSCASSTVTMQMGIERILNEKFENMGEVIQVEGPSLADVAEANELTMEVVMKEVNRIKPAITAMGGTVEILDVDPIGVVHVKFRGANKVQQGLELALRDVNHVKHVHFVN